MKNGVFEMQVDSEGVLINKALYLGRDQMYYYPKHYERTSPAGTGRMGEYHYTYLTGGT